MCALAEINRGVVMTNGWDATWLSEQEGLSVEATLELRPGKGQPHAKA